MPAGRALQVEYTTQDAFRAEYTSNISRGGIFVATTDDVQVRDTIDVELALLFCDQFMVLEGEIVHHVPPDMEGAGATPGVAVQFNLPVSEIRDRLGEFAGPDASPDERVRKTGRRAAPRSRARVPATVDLGGEGALVGQTRDVSASGLLLEVKGEPVPVGDSVSLILDHPVTGEKMQVEGRVVRHVKSSRGQVTAMGVELAQSGARQTEVASFMSDVQATEHSRRLGAINGPIAELGISNLLQMFASTMPQGTLSVVNDDADGTIGFESGQLLWAEIDGLHGQPALETMLALRSGYFELESRLVEPLAGRDDPVSLEAAILEALCALDEGNRDAASTPAPEEVKAKPRRKASGSKRAAKAPRPKNAHKVPASSKPVGKIALEKVAAEAAKPAPPPRRTKSPATFRIDVDALEESRDDLDQTETAVVELAQVGMNVDKMLEVIPEPQIEVLIAIDALVARGVLEVE